MKRGGLGRVSRRDADDGHNTGFLGETTFITTSSSPSLSSLVASDATRFVLMGREDAIPSGIILAGSFASFEEPQLCPGGDLHCERSTCRRDKSKPTSSTFCPLPFLRRLLSDFEVDLDNSLFAFSRALELPDAAGFFVKPPFAPEASVSTAAVGIADKGRVEVNFLVKVFGEKRIRGKPLEAREAVTGAVADLKRNGLRSSEGLFAL